MYGIRIKSLREEKGLTQKSLSKILNTTQSTVAKWEREDLEPNIDMIVKMADVFNVCTDYLLGRKDWY